MKKKIVNRELSTIVGVGRGFLVYLSFFFSLSFCVGKNREGVEGNGQDG